MSAARRVLVLGGCGFVGSNLVHGLVSAGFQVRVLDLRRQPALELPAEVERIEGDFTHRATLDAAVENMDGVFHLASATTPQSGTADPVHDVNQNLIGALNLIEACVLHRVRRLVFISSGGTVYGKSGITPIPEDHRQEPLNSYGVVKLAIEKYLGMYRALGKLDPIVLRASNPYGPGQFTHGAQGAIAVALGALQRGTVFHLWGTGEVVRDFLYIDDLTRAFLRAFDAPVDGPWIFNIGSGTGHSLLELLRACELATGRTLLLERLPGRPIDVLVNVLDASRAREQLRWTPENPPRGRIGAHLAVGADATLNRANGGLMRFLREPARLRDSLALAARALLRGGPRGLAIWLGRGTNLGEALAYPDWIARHDSLDAAARLGLELRAKRLPESSLISLAPEPIADLESLQTVLGAARKQIHPHWELLLTQLPGSGLTAHLTAAAEDPRVRLLGEFPDRASAWTAAMAGARGTHLCLLDDDAVLREQSLLRFAEAIVATPTIDLLYADHDRVTSAGVRHAPFFKPAFHPELAWSLDPFGPLALIRTGLARELGLRAEFAPAERFELLLRASESGKVQHLPELLSHLREGALVDSLPSIDDAELRAVQAQLDRKLPLARVEPGPSRQIRRVRMAPPNPKPLISAIIPTRDGVAVLRRCAEGLLERTDWTPLELIVVDNGSRDPATLDFLEELRKTKRARVLHDDGPFNFSALNNRAAQVASGELLALLNDDLEMVDPSWLAELAGHALRPEIGAVGARLLYPDGRVQHAGVATGVLGLAGHLMRGVPRDAPGPNGWAQILRGSTVVTAACMVLRRELFLDAGGFDERDLAVAFNDVDLCLRLSARGLRNLYVPTAELIHHESWSRGSDQTPEKRGRFARELQTMLLRWPDLFRDPFYSPNLTLASEQMQPGSPPRR